MEQHFTHLHLHTEFSLLDGAIKLDQLIEFGKAHNLKALAITDHGYIFGAVKFFQKCNHLDRLLCIMILQIINKSIHNLNNLLN